MYKLKVSRSQPVLSWYNYCYSGSRWLQANRCDSTLSKRRKLLLMPNCRRRFMRLAVLK